MDRVQRFKVYNRQLHEDLWIYILSRVRDESASRDILQETLADAWENFHKLRNEEKFLSWVFAIARNNILSNYKTKGKHAANSINVDDVAMIDSLHPVARGESAEDAALYQMEYNDAMDFISRLPHDTKQIISLHVSHGKTFNEIGSILNMPTEKVKAKYYRVKKKFEEYIRR